MKNRGDVGRPIASRWARREVKVDHPGTREVDRDPRAVVDRLGKLVFERDLAVQCKRARRAESVANAPIHHEAARDVAPAAIDLVHAAILVRSQAAVAGLPTAVAGLPTEPLRRPNVSPSAGDLRSALSSGSGDPRRASGCGW
jgi:hypothetical protein